MVAALHEEPIVGARDAAAEAAERLVDLQLAFNLYPAMYAHPSWLQRCAGPLAAESSELTLSPLWIRALSTALLRHERLDEHCECDFFNPAKRLALMEAPTLIRIGGLVTATLLRERLRRVISRAEVQAAEACMGVEAHRYAVRWQGTVPLIGPVFDEIGWPSAEVWQRKSVAQLFAAIPSYAVGVTGRMRLRFPCDWTLPDARQARMNEPQRVALTRFIVAVILDAAPEWRWLFESQLGSRPELEGA
jgi:hypothetical protein